MSEKKTAARAAKLLIVGGGPGGRVSYITARRFGVEPAVMVLNEEPTVICSLPYGVGRRLIPDGPEATVVDLSREKRLPPDAAKDVVFGSVTAIDAAAKTATVAGPAGETQIAYENLILAPGAVPWLPPAEGILKEKGAASGLMVAVGDRLVDRSFLADGVYVLRGAQDARALDELAARSQKVAVVGTGAVGLEIIEALSDRGVDVVAVEALPHAVSALDADMAAAVECRLRERGVELHLNDAVTSWTPGTLTLRSGALAADALVFASGVRPRLDLARAMGLKTERGIVVDATQRTSLPSVWAVGDAAQIADAASGKSVLPLIGTLAMRQAMTAVMDIAGLPAQLPPATLWGVSEIFGLHWGAVGWSEEMAQRAGLKVVPLSLPVRSRDPFMPSGKDAVWKVVLSTGEDEGFKPGQILSFQIVSAGDNPVHLAERFVDIVARRETVQDLFGRYFIHSPAHNSVDDPFLALIALAMEKMPRR